MATYDEIKPKFPSLYITGGMSIMYVMGGIKAWNDFGINAGLFIITIGLIAGLIFLIELVKIYVLNWADLRDEPEAIHFPIEPITSNQEVVSVTDSKRLDDGTRLGQEFSKGC